MMAQTISKLTIFSLLAKFQPDADSFDVKYAVLHYIQDVTHIMLHMAPANVF